MKTDLILTNGTIHTLDKPAVASTIAVAGDRIAAVAGDEVLALAGPETQVIDLHGRCVVPGLIDAHLHLAWFGQTLGMVNLEGALSVDECVQRVRRAAAGPAGWILGDGWDHYLWTPPDFPDRHALDRVAPDRPVVLRRKDGHSIWANSLALKLAGIDATTPEPPGGAIDREEHGEPAGILRENAIELVWRVVPQPGPADIEHALLLAQGHALAFGLIGVHTMESPDVFAACQRLDAAAKLTLRIYHSIQKEHLDEAIGVGLRTGFGNDRLRVGGVKLFADGSLGSMTAAMLDDYIGQPGRRGVVTLPKDEMQALVRRATAAGIAPVIHAIGDAANRAVLDVYEENRAQGDSLRYRIEHVQILHPADIPRLARLGVVASMQPLHGTADRDAATRLWGERSRYAYAWRSVLAAGAPIAFGSDCPVETINPLAGIYAAVTRQRAGEPDVPSWYPEECLTPEQALRAYTLGAAYASGEETSKGSLAAGKLADMVVLSQDILAIPPQEILRTRVEMTISGGQIVYNASI